MGLLDCKHQGISLCAKWIVWAMQGNKSQKVLIQRFISFDLPLNYQAWRGMDLPSLITTLVTIKIQGSFIIHSIWKAW